MWQMKRFWLIAKKLENEDKLESYLTENYAECSAGERKGLKVRISVCHS